MNKMNWKWILAFAAALVGMAVLLNSLAWAGKPQPPTPPPPPPVKYQVTWLQQIGQDLYDGVSPGTVWRVNDWGEVVGYLRFSDGVNSAFHYSQATGLQELDDLIHPQDEPGANSDWLHLSSASGVNNRGQILGSGVHVTAGDGQKFRLTQQPNGVPLVEYVGDPQVRMAGTCGINDDGDVVGGASNAEMPCLWLQKTDGSMVMIDLQPDPLLIGPSAPYGFHSDKITDRYELNGGTYIQVTGRCFHDVRSRYYGYYSAFRYTGRIDADAGTFTGTRFEDLGAIASIATVWDRGMNNLGDVVGWATLSVKKPTYTDHAVLFPASGDVVDLGTLGKTGCYAYGINDSWQIVGCDTTSSGTIVGFLYVDGKMYNLQQLIEGDLSVWQSARWVQARSINNPLVPGGFGQIAGTLEMPDGRNYGFLLTPKNP